MGRQSAFVREDAVRSARDVFWSEGYEGASMASLQRATGLNASSIYHAFGSKHGLFDAAIEDYLECVVRPGLAPLRAPEVAPDALERYFLAARALGSRVAGVHVGQRDLPAVVVRRLIGDGAYLGLSASTPEEVAAAEAEGA